MRFLEWQQIFECACRCDTVLDEDEQILRWKAGATPSDVALENDALADATPSDAVARARLLTAAEALAGPGVARPPRDATVVALVLLANALPLHGDRRPLTRDDLARILEDIAHDLPAPE